MKWKVLASEYLHKEPWLTIRKDKCELPDGQVFPSFYVQEYPDWVNAFALTKDNIVVMVKYPSGQVHLFVISHGR